jgi:hypothetical protein
MVGKSDKIMMLQTHKNFKKRSAANLAAHCLFSRPLPIPSAIAKVEGKTIC